MGYPGSSLLMMILYVDVNLKGLGFISHPIVFTYVFDFTGKTELLPLRDLTKRGVGLGPGV